MGSVSPTLSIAIIGGGIAGLSLGAALLKKQHIDVHIYESVPAHKDVGAGLALHRNAIKAMALLGPKVHQAYLDKAIDITSDDADEEMATEVILAQGPHAGKKVAELGRAKGRKSVSRADLLAGLLELIPSNKISFGKKLASITPPSSEQDQVSFKFEDGSEAKADCLLGADGIHSVVRVFLLGEDDPTCRPKNHDQWQIYRTLVSTEEAKQHIDERFTRTVPILLGPRGHINCIPLNKGTRLSAGVAVRGAADTEPEGPEKSSASSDKKLDPSLYQDYTSEARAIVELVAKDTSASWSVGDHDHAHSFVKGRIAMLGDAAHASLPFAGQGAAQALEDAAVLDNLFGRVRQTAQIEHALNAYDAVRRPRSQAVVDMARKFGRVYSFSERTIHEDPEKMKDFFRTAGHFTNDFDLMKQNEAAVAKMEGSVRGRSAGGSNANGGE
ncbi:hypothetical protein QBC35DRAFT_396541 [Podospora australis]|uniref:FAD-binding domain-containing protein n=1 Tax=Podospora australis TaxID=1536484 RepID=A0AAN7ACI0_9PEZI|nr:hypothetical protein QBC35DRAFT_396541 [Podospora australis]